MIKNYPNEHVDVCLIATTEVELGARGLSSFLKEKGYTVLAGFFDSDGMYTDGEIDSIRAWVKETGPRVIGISAIEFSRDKALKLIEALKALGKPVFVGGIDAGPAAEEYLRHADFVISGEGEEACAELVSALLSGKETRNIANLCYRDASGKTVRNTERPPVPDLDLLPHEDWLDVTHHYELLGGRVRRKREFTFRDAGNQMVNFEKNVFMFTARGCAFNCSYCNASRPLRKRSVAPVVGRVRQLKNTRPSVEMVYFLDNDFFLRTPEEIREFSAAWKTEVDLPFFAFCTPSSLTEEKLDALVEAGLAVIVLGVQSGSERTNKEIYDRHIPNSVVAHAAAILRARIGKGRFGLRFPNYDFIINNPYETRADLLETIALIRRLPKPYFALTPSLEFYQGTALYGRAVRDGKLAGRDPSTPYNCLDTLRHFAGLRKQGGHYYLNSLLYWMNGFHTGSRYGIVPAPLLGTLTGRGTIEFFERRPWLVTVLNRILPTHMRVENAKARLRRRLEAHGS